ncbi:MAG: hypothetical protein LBJ82_01420 [Deltaproteobacteria bacterium]|jgi:hypothetical protein|nr:hypothetical protein [Deltaproteobacteria bacterium]
MPAFCDSASLPALLAAAPGFWEHWGFVPWAEGQLSGVSREQHLIKDGFLGRIAEYRAFDCIIWNVGTARDRESLWRGLAPLPEVMTQRFLFLKDDPAPRRRVRSFWGGIRGFAEFYSFWPGAAKENAPRDLSGLVLLALKMEHKGALDAAARADR